MGGTYNTTMGDRGRLVIPAELREELGLETGSSVILLTTPEGAVLATREQVKTLVQKGLQGPSLVSELLDERRKNALTEDAA